MTKKKEINLDGLIATQLINTIEKILYFDIDFHYKKVLIQYEIDNWRK